MKEKKYDFFIEEVERKKLGEVITNASLKEYCTLHIGGTAKIIYIPENLEQLKEAFKIIVDNSLSFFVIGKGSNLLISDDYHEKIFINLKKINQVNVNNNLVKVYSGALTNKLARSISLLGYTGLEFLAGIPGSIGGAIYMNAGAWNKEISEVVKDVTYLDENANLCLFVSHKDSFSYRCSPFQKRKVIIVGCTLKVKLASREEMPLKIYQTYLDKKKKIQPCNVYSAGCAFKNPKSQPAWRLIENASCGKLKIGDAMVSKKHKNFLINKKEATFADMEKLLYLVQSEVYDKYLVKLELEWNILK